MSGVVFVPAQRLSSVVLTLPVVSLQSRFVTGRFATKSFRYGSFCYKVVSLQVVSLQSRFVTCRFATKSFRRIMSTWR